MSNISASYAAPGVDCSVTYDSDGSIQASFTQQLSARLFGNVVTYLSGPNSGLVYTGRLETGTKTDFPRSVFVGAVNVNSISGLSTATLEYSKLFSKHFFWASELSQAPNQRGEVELKATTGFQLNYSSFSGMSNLKCMLNDRGDIICILDDSIAPQLFYTVSMQANLKENNFAVGLGINLSMD